MSNRPIFLCGFMGCGKTTVGKKLAKLLGCDFTDMDHYIEQTEGMTISEIFKLHGEEYFRDLETAAIKSFEGKSGVIATGGGALLRRENGEEAKRIGTPIFINVRFTTCYMRIKDDPNRPIAHNSTREELYRLYRKRKPKYIKNSNYIIDGNKSSAAIARQIKEMTDQGVIR